MIHTEDYREHRIAALPAGPVGWRAYVDMVDVGRRFATSYEAMEAARARIDEAWREEELRNMAEANRVLAETARGRPVLTVIQGGLDG